MERVFLRFFLFLYSKYAICLYSEKGKIRQKSLRFIQ